jgi:hypothetical protein
MEHTRRRTTVIVLLLICLPALLLGALPALGLRLDGGRLPIGPDLVAKGRANGAIWTTAVKFSGRVSDPLSPGVSSPIVVTISNQNPKVVKMKRVRVTIANIYAPHADANHLCTKLDFQIRQMPRQTLQVPARKVIDLGGLGLPATSWPTVAMLNRPVNQDGCKGAQLTLRLRAARLTTRRDR